MHRLLNSLSLLGGKSFTTMGLGLTSTAVMVDTESGGARMVQQLLGKYGANHCHVATGHLY